MVVTLAAIPVTVEIQEMAVTPQHDWLTQRLTEVVAVVPIQVVARTLLKVPAEAQAAQVMVMVRAKVLVKV